MKRRRWSDKDPLKSMLAGTGWRTPDTYGGEFETLPNVPGVYLLLRFNKFFEPIDIAYVGQAKNLATRLSGMHEVYRFLRRENFVQRWFKAIPHSAIRSAAELYFIDAFKPPLNVRGVR